jgi:hypothetical protein
MLAVSGSTKWMIAKSKKRSLVVVGLEPHISAAPTVTAIGAAFRDMRLTSKTDATCPPIARFRVQLSAINEGRHPFILRLDLAWTFFADDRITRRRRLAHPFIAMGVRGRGHESAVVL